MKVSELKLTNFNQREFTVHAYHLAPITDLKKPRRPLAIVVPGGSFNHLSQREGEPVALAFASHGFQAAVMEYNLVQDPGQIYPDAALDVLSTINYYRQHAEQEEIDPQQIVVIGFSAGGHVVAIANNFATDSNLAAKYGYQPEQVKANAAILGYPLIDIAKIGIPIPPDQWQYLPEQAEIRNAALAVNQQLPPTFIFHAWDDPLVLVENSLDYVKRLKEVGADCEFHLFARGRHGFSLARPEMVTNKREWQNNPHASHWFSLAREWLQEIW